MATGTLLGAPYPCRCTDRWACAHERCPCWGRTDLAGLTLACCGVRRYLGMVRP